MYAVYQEQQDMIEFMYDRIQDDWYTLHYCDLCENTVFDVGS